jgi:hypothetical protein
MAVRLAARATAWTLGAWAAMQLGAILFSRTEAAGLALQAGIAEWSAGRLGVSWSDPLAPVPSTSAIARRAGVGAAAGLGAAVLAVGLSVVVGHVQIAVGVPAVASLLMGALIALLVAVRDELLLRGMVLQIGKPLWGPIGGVALCAAAAAAARLGAVEPTVLAVVVEAIRASALACVWVRDRGAWMAVGANTAWTWALGSAIRGDVLDVRSAVEPGSNVAALVVVLVFAVASVRWAARARVE